MDPPVIGDPGFPRCRPLPNYPSFLGNNPYVSPHQPPPPPPPGYVEEYMPCSSQPAWRHFQYPQRPPGRRLIPSLGPPFLCRKQYEWGIDFYIRIDNAGYYHAYPYVGGPFQNLQEAEHAIERYLHNRRDPKMFSMDNMSRVDIAVRNSLYFPDGTRRRRLRSEPVDEIRDSQRQLVNALMDKYNEDNNLLGDLAYEVNAVVWYQPFCEGDLRMWYHHINFTAKTKATAYCEFFFAEVIFMQEKSLELPVSCLCRLKPTDNGNCFGCIDNGSVDMMHPSDVGYAGGHAMNTYQPFSGPRVMPGSHEEESYEAEEARLRSTLQCLDDPEMMEGPPRPSKFWDSLVKVYIGPPGYSDRDRVPPGFPGSGHNAPPARPAQYFGVGSGATQCFAPPGLSGLSSS
ncbi:hypothetical protein ACQJBY_047576 [Aegilops geniculata]